MDDAFKIYIEQLRNGQERVINEKLDPDFLEVNETDLVFKKEVDLHGTVYLADKELILHWNAETEALIPCSICNDKVPVKIEVKNFYHSEPTADIKTGIFNFKELLRNTILLETPQFVECHNGKCPDRKEIKKYLKDASDNDNEGQHPFANLDL